MSVFPNQAQALDASLTATDLLPGFLRSLEIAAERQSPVKWIETLVASMDMLPFEEQSFDTICSEDTNCNSSFVNSIRAWVKSHRYSLRFDPVKTGTITVFSIQTFGDETVKRLY